jgi:PAS domain-containing protein
MFPPNTDDSTLRVAAAAVADLGHLALTGASLDELLHEAVRLTAKTLPAERVAVLRYDDGANALEVASVVVDEVVGETCGPGLFWESCRSAVVAPVRTRGAPDWGVLAVCSRESREWTPDEVVLVRLSANTLAEAVDTLQAESRRARAEELVASAVESLPDVFVQFDRALRATYVNGAVLTETGFPPTRFVGRRLTEVYPESDTLGFIESELQEVLASGEGRTTTTPRAGWSASPSSRATSPSASSSRSGCGTRLASRRSASSPAASPTTSTTSWSRSAATPTSRCAV